MTMTKYTTDLGYTKKQATFLDGIENNDTKMKNFLKKVFAEAGRDMMGKSEFHTIVGDMIWNITGTYGCAGDVWEMLGGNRSIDNGRKHVTFWKEAGEAVIVRKF